MKPIRWALAPMQVVAPALSERVAERLFFTPHRTRPSAALRKFVATGRQFELSVRGRRVVGWCWGQGPVVYLMHGWGSRGGRLAAFAPPLLNAGYSVVAFDAPGHGASGRGMSSMPEFARALAAVVEYQGTAHAIIAHSLGCAATTLAVSGGLPVSRLVFLAPPANPATWVTGFARALALRPAIVEGLQRRSEARLDFRWSELDVPTMAREMKVPLFIAHDSEDRVVPWRDGAAVAAAWPGATMVTTSGLGHSGVVREPDIVRQAVAFVRDAEASAAWEDESTRLEYELFCRESRWVHAAV